ncbi:MAG: glycosyltransferase [Candidatus Omnitrophota bacterium]
MAKYKHIMQIVPSLECGGMEKLAIDLAERLKIAGYLSSICCLDRAGDLTNQAEAKGIDVVVMSRKPGIDMSLPITLSKILKNKKVDIAHTHNLEAMIYGTLAARFAGIPVVINTRHGREDKRANWLFWSMNNAVIAISEDAKRRFLTFNRIKYDKLRVIYNGIDAASSEKLDTRSIKEKIFKVDARYKIIGTVSRLSEEKYQVALLDAFQKVSQAVKNVILVFVGDGPLKQALHNYSEKLGIADKIIFLGFRADAREIVEAFDIFALPSLTEGISLSLLEAMAARKPVVATNVGGNPEVVVDGDTGILVPPKDPQKMAEAIIKLIQNSDLAKKMGQAGRKRMEEKFSLNRMVNEYELIYEECLAKK